MLYLLRVYLYVGLTSNSLNWTVPFWTMPRLLNYRKLHHMVSACLFNRCIGKVVKFSILICITQEQNHYADFLYVPVKMEKKIEWTIFFCILIIQHQSIMSHGKSEVCNKYTFNLIEVRCLIQEYSPFPFYYLDLYMCFYIYNVLTCASCFICVLLVWLRSFRSYEFSYPNYWLPGALYRVKYLLLVAIHA